MLLLLGLGALALVKGRPVEWGSGALWMWPVPDMVVADRTYPAVITDGFGSDRPEGRSHHGVDIAYARKSATDRPEYKSGTPDGTPQAFAPRNAPIIAARAGRVWSARRTPRGFAVVIDHGAPFATFYQHLEVSSFPEHAHGANVATGKPTAIRMGDIIGTMGFDPLDKQRFRHLHFAVWANGNDDAAVDPAAAMRSWSRAPWKWNPART